MVGKKRLLVFGVFGLLMVSLMMSFVGADTVVRDSSSGGILLTISDGIGGVADSIGLTGNEMISRWLLTALLVMLVYAVAAKMPFLSGTSDGAKALRWGFSIVVGILGFILVDGQEIQTILTNYQALGVALTSIIPLVILATFFWEFKNSSNATMKAVGGVIEKPLFVLFGVYLVIKWAVLAGEGSALAWIYILTLIIVVIWLLFGSAIYKRFTKFKSAAETKIAGEKLDKSVRMTQMNAAQFDALTKDKQDAFTNASGIIVP